MKIKAIMFDNDGVLVDTEHLYFKATKLTMQSIGYDLTEDEYIEYFLRQGKGCWHLIDQEKYNVQDIRAKRNELYLELIKQESFLISNVPEVISKLGAKYKLCIVTTSVRKHFEAIHKNTDLLKYFEFTLCREDYKNAKPDAEPYLTALEKLNLTKEEVVIIEDSERGLYAANNAGIKCIVIPTGHTENGNFSTAYKQLNSINELENELENLNGNNK